MIGVRKVQLYKIGIVFLLLLSSLWYLGSSQAHALSGNDFEAGRIIDDSVFYNNSTLSVDQIQAFLEAKVPVCDTNGSQPYGGTTRAAYGASVGHPAPYICLKDYSQSVPAVNNSSTDYCTGDIASGTKSASRIIF